MIAELLFLVLQSDDRTKRALRLIYPMLGVYLITLALIVALVFTGDLPSPTVFAVVASLAVMPASLLRLAVRNRQ